MFSGQRKFPMIILLTISTWFSVINIEIYKNRESLGLWMSIYLDKFYVKHKYTRGFMTNSYFMNLPTKSIKYAVVFCNVANTATNVCDFVQGIIDTLMSEWRSNTDWQKWFMCMFYYSRTCCTHFFPSWLCDSSIYNLTILWSLVDNVAFFQIFGVIIEMGVGDFNDNDNGDNSNTIKMIVVVDIGGQPWINFNCLVWIELLDGDLFEVGNPCWRSTFAFHGLGKMASVFGAAIFVIFIYSNEFYYEW